MLTITDLSLRIAGRLLLDHASLTLPEGAKAGLVGRNGTGKTTLFRAIAGELSPGRAARSRCPRARASARSRRKRRAPKTADRHRAGGRRRARRAARRGGDATDPHRIAEIHMRLADIDAHSARSARRDHPRRPRLRRGGAGAGPARTSPAAGACAWRSPACCSPSPTCCCSTSRPTISTSKARSGSRACLASYPHTVLLISHDRDLLNRRSTRSCISTDGS